MEKFNYNRTRTVFGQTIKVKGRNTTLLHSNQDATVKALMRKVSPETDEAYFLAGRNFFYDLLRKKWRLFKKEHQRALSKALARPPQFWDDWVVVLEEGPEKETVRRMNFELHDLRAIVYGFDVMLPTAKRITKNNPDWGVPV